MSATPTRNSKTRNTGTAGRRQPASTEPAEDVSLDLDTLEREGGKEPFTFRHEGRRYTICDPEEMDWQKQLRAFSDPVYFLQNAMSPEDVDAFFEAAMPGWKLEAVMKGFRRHFGLPELGESAGSPI